MKIGKTRTKRQTDTQCRGRAFQRISSRFPFSGDGYRAIYIHLSCRKATESLTKVCGKGRDPWNQHIRCSIRLAPAFHNLPATKVLQNPNQLLFLCIAGALSPDRSLHEFQKTRLVPVPTRKWAFPLRQWTYPNKRTPKSHRYQIYYTVCIKELRGAQ